MCFFKISSVTYSRLGVESEENNWVFDRGLHLIYRTLREFGDDWSMIFPTVMRVMQETRRQPTYFGRFTMTASQKQE